MSDLMMSFGGERVDEGRLDAKPIPRFYRALPPVIQTMLQEY